MKYYSHVVNPEDANLKSWQIHKSNGFTYILPKENNNFECAYSLLYHKAKNENILLISPNSLANHNNQLDLLFKYLKLPKGAPHLDCLVVGVFVKKPLWYIWGRTFKPPATDILHDVSDKKLIKPKELTPQELILTKIIEKTFENYIVCAQKISKQRAAGKKTEFKIEEIIPKIKKRPAKRIVVPKPNLKLPIRKLR